MTIALYALISIVSFALGIVAGIHNSRLTIWALKAELAAVSDELLKHQINEVAQGTLGD